MEAIDACAKAATGAAAAAAVSAAAEETGGEDGASEDGEVFEAVVLVRFLMEALDGVPLPSPWVMRRDTTEEIFFANKTTGAASWRHPLQVQLIQLAKVCRSCLLMSPAKRKEAAVLAKECWEVEARAEYEKWYPVRHGSGQDYYCHRETGEAMWQHPGSVLLPAHFLRLRAAERLQDDVYMSRLQLDTVLEVETADGSHKVAPVAEDAMMRTQASAVVERIGARRCPDSPRRFCAWKQKCAERRAMVVALLLDLLLGVWQLVYNTRLHYLEKFQWGACRSISAHSPVQADESLAYFDMVAGGTGAEAARASLRGMLGGELTQWSAVH